MSTQVKVVAIPDCDVCKGAGRQGVPAYADAKLSAGPWANVCREHFDLYHCTLGTGKGQQFVLRDESPKPAMPFADWMQLVDRELASICGFSHDDLADYDYWESWSSHESPSAVAASVLVDNGFEGLE